MCIDCGRAPAADGRRVCDDCLAVFIRDWERRHGLPPGGRDPAEVRHELACGRGAALLLHGRLTGNRDDEHAAMTVVLTECYERPGLTPAAALVDPLLNLTSAVLVDAPQPPGPPPPPPPPNVVRVEPVRWCSVFVERLRDAGMIAAAEADVTDDAELVRDCRATEAATVVMRGRLTGDAELEAHGWSSAEALAAEDHATAPGVLLGPILGLVNDHVRGGARERLIECLRDAILTWAPTPDTPEGLT
ncbi:hypothetical protein C3477_06800 [Mycobacterium kansasii]|nr:hypothetical protein C3B43_06530 [Mycobacterium kansasii]POY07668.1 hypothetical protein C3477_06800 [Mycobacterium kansasii]